MGLLDSLLKKSKDKKENSRRLSNEDVDRLVSDTYDVVFSEQALGLVLTKADSSDLLEVTGLTEGGEGQRLGVKEGDVIIEVEGQASTDYDAFISTVGIIGRPLHLKFRRGASPVAEKRQPASSTGPSAFGKSLKEAQESMRAKFEGPKPPPPLSESEKAAQREERLRAAEARTQAWDKKLQKGKAAGRELGSPPPDSVVEASFTSEETRKMVELCKQKEQATASQLGYNPYEPKMVVSAQARQAVVDAVANTNGTYPGSGSVLGTSGSMSSSSNGRASPPPPPISSTEMEQAATIMDELEEIFGLMLSSAPEDTVRTALQTVTKMLTNMIEKRDDKFRRVRTENANFSEKVGSVPGGLDLMQAAGFALFTPEEGGAYLHYAEAWDPIPLRLRVVVNRVAEVKQGLEAPRPA